MWIYQKTLQHPVKVGHTDLAFANRLLSMYGGPDGELAAALRYLNQRYTMPTNNTKGLLTDIGTEEMGHVEMIATMIYKLTKDADLDEVRESMFGNYFVDHGKALYFCDANGAPFTVTYFQAKDDPIADLTENMAAEQKARATYNHLMELTDDPDLLDTLRFLRQREIVHFQRFGEALDQVQEYFACKKVF
ncbi:MAG: manganese catalase family protein [Firmicutes bacterium]|nr:manganese catalase family protein [Bacillota bacterium]